MPSATSTAGFGLGALLFLGGVALISASDGAAGGARSSSSKRSKKKGSKSPLKPSLARAASGRGPTRGEPSPATPRGRSPPLAAGAVTSAASVDDPLAEFTEKDVLSTLAESRALIKQGRVHPHVPALISQDPSKYSGKVRMDVLEFCDLMGQMAILLRVRGVEFPTIAPHLVWKWAEVPLPADAPLELRQNRMQRSVDAIKRLHSLEKLDALLRESVADDELFQSSLIDLALLAPFLGRWDILARIKSLSAEEYQSSVSTIHSAWISKGIVSMPSIQNIDKALEGTASPRPVPPLSQLHWGARKALSFRLRLVDVDHSNPEKQAEFNVKKAAGGQEFDWQDTKPHRSGLCVEGAWCHFPSLTLSGMTRKPFDLQGLTPMSPEEPLVLSNVLVAEMSGSTLKRHEKLELMGAPMEAEDSVEGGQLWAGSLLIHTTTTKAAPTVTEISLDGGEEPESLTETAGRRFAVKLLLGPLLTGPEAAVFGV